MLVADFRTKHPEKLTSYSVQVHIKNCGNFLCQVLVSFGAGSGTACWPEKEEDRRGRHRREQPVCNEGVSNHIRDHGHSEGPQKV